MNEQKDEKWLDELISRTINTEEPAFDAETWKRKYSEEFQTLVDRAARPVSTAPARRPNVVRMILSRPFVKVAAAAVIIVAVGLFIAYRGPGERKEPSIPIVAKSPADMTSAISLAMAYRRGGMAALDKQLSDTIEMLGSRQKSLSIQDLL